MRYQLMVLEQQSMIEKVGALCRAEPRLVAALMYGSFAQGEGDEHSDIDFYLFFDGDALGAIDRRGWLERIAPIELLYENEFGVTTAIFERLVRGEFHFEPASNIKQIAAWDAWWPDVEAAVVVDRTGELTAIVASQPRAPRRNATRSQSEFVVDSLCNWTVMGLHLLARGELARSMDVLNLLHAHLLTAVRIVEGAPLTWHESRHLEAHLSTSSYERYRRCTQLELTRAGLGRAYAATWDWSRDLMAELSTSFAHDARSRVVGLIDTTIGTGRTDPAHRPPGRE